MAKNKDILSQYSSEKFINKILTLGIKKLKHIITTTNCNLVRFKKNIATTVQEPPDENDVQGLSENEDQPS